MSDLERLIEAVEAGEWPRPHIGSGGGSDQQGKINGVDARIFRHGREAFSGSLDAALRLHEALLPEWGWSLNFQHSTRYPERQSSALVDAIDPFRCFGANAANPARAWLLSILRALQANTETGGE